MKTGRGETPFNEVDNPVNWDNFVYQPRFKATDPQKNQENMHTIRYKLDILL